MWSTTKHKSKVMTTRTNWIVSVCVQPYLFTCPYMNKWNWGSIWKRMSVPNCPMKYVSRHRPLWRKTIKRRGRNSCPDRVPSSQRCSSLHLQVLPCSLPRFLFLRSAFSLPTVWGPSLGSMWPQEWAQQRKPEHSGVSRWILAFVPLQRAAFPFDTAAQTNQWEDPQWTLQLSIMGRTCTSK